MFQRKSAWLLYILIGLAIVGFTVSMFNNPGILIKNLLISLLIGAVIFGLIYYFFIYRRMTSNNELKKYRQAVKQSKQKYGKRPKANPVSKPSNIRKKPSIKNKPSRKHAPHLRVIDGNKQKKKDRASL
ncbi:hypothetical protein J416_05523 [Gracilibacillus halophilus YIM-C55.5]|uniref:Uncharacterized protein n=1 Tax=Gracilibacillus halophilus YIM-C55.5 TaxID=1308866 RepID=N4WMR3_9BACI|nr:SA1362 family protein [Gracilibacillus halophilus]ENH97447.1 hypothetical protein J416_05523 [Gracilibacillus halophilus YIM-C55.5]